MLAAAVRRAQQQRRHLVRLEASRAWGAVDEHQRHEEAASALGALARGRAVRASVVVPRPEALPGSGSDESDDEALKLQQLQRQANDVKNPFGGRRSLMGARREEERDPQCAMARGVAPAVGGHGRA